MGSGLLLVMTAYLIGAIPFGFIVARLVKGIDIREHGSGNIGATNVGRVLGGKWGALVLVLDLLKGLLPVLLLPRLFLLMDDPRVVHWQVEAGFATIFGHMYPCWLGFRGGKGVATALGVVLCLAPVASAVAIAVFAASFAVWRFVSLSSMLAATGFAITEIALLLPDPFAPGHWSIATFSLLVPAVIVVRHRKNIGRLIRGEEPKYRSKGADDSPDRSPQAAEPKNSPQSPSP